MAENIYQRILCLFTFSHLFDKFTSKEKMTIEMIDTSNGNLLTPDNT